MPKGDGRPAGSDWACSKRGLERNWRWRTECRGCGQKRPKAAEHPTPPADPALSKRKAQELLKGGGWVSPAEAKKLWEKLLEKASALLWHLLFLVLVRYWL